MAYCLVVVVSPSVRPLRAAGAALAWCWGVEFLPLTDLPGRLSGQYLLARLILGSTFNAPDLMLYALGILVSLTVHTRARRSATG